MSGSSKHVDLLVGSEKKTAAGCGHSQPQPTRTVYSEPIILPLNADGKLYALEDEQGRIVGTGTREICEALLTMMKNETFLFRHLRSDQSDRNPKRQ